MIFTMSFRTRAKQSRDVRVGRAGLQPDVRAGVPGRRGIGAHNVNISRTICHGGYLVIIPRAFRRRLT